MIHLAAPEELALAKHLLNFGLTLEAVAEELRPNYLCNYLYELAGKFTAFYEHCPVLKAGDDATRDSRLALCDLTARVLKQRAGHAGHRDRRADVAMAGPRFRCPSPRTSG